MNMKQTLAYTILAFSFLSSCSSSSEGGGNVNISKDPHQISVNTSELQFGANTDLMKSFIISATNTSWNIASTAEWLTTDKTSGRERANVEVTAKENTSASESRMAFLRITSAEKDYKYNWEITATQNVAQKYITPSVTSLSCNASSGTKDIAVDSNVEWDAECIWGWLHLEKEGKDKLKVSFEENLSGQSRTATVSFYGLVKVDEQSWRRDNVYSTLTITQAEAGVTGEDKQINFDVNGETKTTDISADVSWTSHVSDASWLSVSPEKGNMGDAKVQITALANESAKSRSGYVYVRIGYTDKLAIPVYQDGILLSSDVEKMDFSAGAGTKQLTLSSNIGWKVQSVSASWISVDPMEGEASDAATVNVKVQNNPNVEQRTGTIVLGKEGFSGNLTIKVTQTGKLFGQLPETLQFENAASSQSVNIVTDGAWDAMTDDSWIHLSPTSGEGPGTLNISVDANPDNESRSGQVVVTVGLTTKIISIVQVGRYINISCDDVLTKSTPSTVRISIESNQEWTVSSDVDWMKSSVSHETGNAEVKVEVADNPSVNSRSGKITIATEKESKVLSFTQPGRKLTVDHTSLEFSAKGGTSDAIVVTTDGKYSVTASDSWITVEETSNTFVVKVEKLEGEESRTGSVVVSLTDLANGEKLERTIQVKQLPNQVYISKDVFDEDEDWNM